MARDFIKIDTSTTTATQAPSLKAFVSALRNAFDQGVKIKAVMDHNQDGSSFADIEALFGLPSGSGSAVYDMVNGAVGSMQGSFQTPDAKNLTERVG